MLAVFLDTETTGLNPFIHRLLEIAFKIVDARSGRELFSYIARVKHSLEVWEKRDPVSVQVNGFTLEKMLEGKEEAQVREEIIQIFADYEIVRGKAVYICQNPAFDRSFFSQLIDISIQEQKMWPYHWLDFASMYWALSIQEHRRLGAPFPDSICLSKNAIAESFGLSPETIPHSAINGVDHLLLCYRKVVGFAGE